MENFPARKLSRIRRGRKEIAPFLVALHGLRDCLQKETDEARRKAGDGPTGVVTPDGRE